MYDRTKEPYPTAILFVDTLELRVGEPLTERQLQQIRGHRRAKHFARHFVEQRPYVNRVRFHRPTAEGLRWIDAETTQNGWALLAIHVALDVPTDRPIKLRKWIDEHIAIPHRRAEKATTDFMGTKYTGQRLDQKNVAVYSDRPSKILGLPCVHVELRLRKSAMLRHAGISHIAKIAQLDLAAMFRRFVHFETFDQREVGRQWRGRRHHRNDYIDHRAGGLLLRSTAYDRHDANAYSAFNARATCAAFGIRPHRVMHEIDPAWLWPITPPPDVLSANLAKPNTRPKSKLHADETFHQHQQ